ncbi:MAG TPA: hypothetical protein VFE61_26820 [Candidatus Sulfotelmatobacter sp.]|nr:hypothetical protein [Candidatus Sulfotelmatobacter sp.]
MQKKLEKSLQDVGGKLRKETERLQMLLDVTSLLSSNWNVQQVFPSVSARIRRVLLQEYAGFELHDHNTGLLVRQVEDFPLGKGLLSAVQISTSNSPGGLSLRERAPLIFTKHQMQRLRLPGTFWQKDFNRFVACRFSDPKRRWGFLCSAAPAWTLFSRTISPC